MAKIPCPIPGYDETGEDGQPRYYVIVPDEWIGEHSEAFYNVYQSLQDAGTKLNPIYQSFVYSLALADDFRLPMLEGKPDRWPAEIFPKFSLKVMAWVNAVVLDSYNACFAVKKNGSMPLLAGLTRTEINQLFGSSARTESEQPAALQN